MPNSIRLTPKLASWSKVMTGIYAGKVVEAVDAWGGDSGRAYVRLTFTDGTQLSVWVDDADFDVRRLRATFDFAAFDFAGCPEAYQPKGGRGA